MPERTDALMKKGLRPGKSKLSAIQPGTGTNRCPDEEGIETTYTISFAGRSVTIEWQESSQNFVIVGTSGGDGGPSLQALLGRWAFVFTIISTFRQTYNLLRIETVQGKQVITGTDRVGDPVIAARVRDLISDPFPFDCALLDPGIIICDLFVFNQVSANRVEGAEIVLTTDAGGNCAAPLTGNLHPMVGTRLASATGARSLPRDQQEAVKVQEAMLNVQSAFAEDLIVDHAALAEIVRQLQP